MPFATNGAVELYFETFGHAVTTRCSSSTGSGVSASTTTSNSVERFVDRGFFVIRYDNRDVGLSSKLDDFTPHLSDVAAARRDGREANVPYRLSDMAERRRRGARRAGRVRGPRRGRVDGRDDRPAARDRPPGAVVVDDVDHVHDRRPRRRKGQSRGRRALLRTAGQGPRERHRAQPGARGALHQSQRVRPATHGRSAWAPPSIDASVPVVSRVNSPA